MLTAELPHSVRKGSIHDSSQNIRELSLCVFFFLFFFVFFFVMSDWISLFLKHAGYLMKYEVIDEVIVIKQIPPPRSAKKNYI